jgi:transcriptional regulator with GAF, ATPase, and Fis domain
LVTALPEFVDTFEALATFARSSEGQVSMLEETGEAKIIGLLEEHHGNVSKVAQRLGKITTHMHVVLKKLGVDAECYCHRIGSL